MFIRKRWFDVGLACAALAAAALAVASSGLAAGKPVAAGAAKTGPSKALVARGQYLATTMCCNDCHTPGALYGAPDFKRQLAALHLLNDGFQLCETGFEALGRFWLFGHG